MGNRCLAIIIFEYSWISILHLILVLVLNTRPIAYYASEQMRVYYSSGLVEFSNFMAFMIIKVENRVIIGTDGTRNTGQ
ncbi:unnamed protein product [Meloidogyne enterolobii]|uniref:Uncharacterized protein n=1 Tax=Meloidogyne enterolobii TaxID=390850 RepID=A0ACB0ZT95_MELEN